MAIGAVLGAAGFGGSQASDARTYVRAISNDAHEVQNDEQQVGLDLVNKNQAAMAQDAQTAHDDYDNVKSDLILAGNNVSDSSRLGDAENQMDDAINELKNGMGALVAFAESPNGGTLGAASAKLGQGITDWDQGAKTIWTLAGDKADIPTLAPSPQPATSPRPAPRKAPTTSTSSTPAASNFLDKYSASNPFCEDGYCAYAAPASGSCAPGYHFNAGADGQPGDCGKPGS
jgi:hypothetical protein